MNGTITPTSDRQLLAEVHRWARTNGWTLSGQRGWVNARFSGEATVAVDYDEHRDGFTLARKGDRIGTWPMYPDFYPAASVRQAVDLLVALDILPARFARAYEAGWHDGYFATAEDETLAEIKASWSTR